MSYVICLQYRNPKRHAGICIWLIQIILKSINQINQITIFKFTYSTGFIALKIVSIDKHLFYFQHIYFSIT